jgi:hypothetical protein
LTHPLTALLLFITATWFWHIPPVYDLALRSSGWHYLQHVCFLGTALLFWYPIVRPYPARPRWSSWSLLPVLLLADVSNTVLSVLLTFSDRVLYPYYAEVPRLSAIGIRLLSGQESRVNRVGFFVDRIYWLYQSAPGGVGLEASITVNHVLALMLASTACADPSARATLIPPT